MKVPIFGATGSIGSVIAQAAVDAGHEVIVYVRDPSKLGDLRDEVTIIQGALDDAHLIDESMQGIDAVISGLGMTGSSQAQADAIVGGVRNIVSAMEKSGTRRIVALSGVLMVVKGDRVGLPFKVMRRLARVLMKQIVRCYTEELNALSDSGLDWTVVRTTFVTNGPATGDIRADASIQMGSRVSREDLAAFFIQQLTDDRFIMKAPMVASG